MSENAQSPIFWEEFYRKHWEQTPGFFEGLFDPHILSADELFDVVVGMKQSGFMLNDRFWISNTRNPVSKNDFSFLPLETYHPTRNDQSFDGYFSRMQNSLGDLPIGINIHRLEKSSPKLWFQLREFVHELNTLVGGLPTGRWDIDTFFGNYETTPLGIHKDNTSVFAIGVLGKRSYYTWPADYFQPGDPALSTLDPAVLAPHLEKAVCMDLEPGNVVYWPSSNWHLIKSDGQPSVVVQISAILGKNLSEVISNHVRHLFAAQLGETDDCKTYHFNSTLEIPPKELMDAHNILVNMVRNGQVAGALQQLWLMYHTADGLYPVPPDTSGNEIGLDDEFSVNPKYPVAWLKSGENVLTIAANGLNFTVNITDMTSVTGMLEKLNSGKKCTRRELIADYPEGSPQIELIKNIIGSLRNCRAFREA